VGADSSHGPGSQPIGRLRLSAPRPNRPSLPVRHRRPRLALILVLVAVLATAVIGLSWYLYVSPGCLNGGSSSLFGCTNPPPRDQVVFSEQNHGTFAGVAVLNLTISTVTPGISTGSLSLILKTTQGVALPLGTAPNCLPGLGLTACGAPQGGEWYFVLLTPSGAVLSVYGSGNPNWDPETTPVQSADLGTLVTNSTLQLWGSHDVLSAFVQASNSPETELIL
jgi:hypothetical protein